MRDYGADFDQKERIKKVQHMGFSQSEKQIFEWVKTSVITLRQFRELNQVFKRELEADQ